MKQQIVYFVGIKGVAMCALAIWYKENGWEVVGSDTSEEFPTDKMLSEIGIKPIDGFKKENIMEVQPQLVIYTGAHGGKSNIEVETAEKLGIECLPHGRAMGRVACGKRVIAVAGSHGKTTTTAMIATILNAAGIDPSWMVGSGEIRGLGLSGHMGGGDWLVVEADEYVTDPNSDLTPRFLWLKPEILVVTNIDWDHPDVYPSMAEVKEVFKKLQNQLIGLRLSVINVDDPESECLIKTDNTSTYGFSERADARITGVKYMSGLTRFLIKTGSEENEINLKVAGKHNVLNATAAALVCQRLGLSWDDIKKGLHQFGGTSRRFELLGEREGGIMVYDDYAHHPSEVVATLAGAREWYKDRRIVVVFQPHTYTRTRALINEFAGAFSEADIVILSDIYASARETEKDKGLMQNLLKTTQLAHINANYLANYIEVKEFLEAQMKPRDVIIFMGAGDIYGWGRKFATENSNLKSQ